MTYQDLLSYLTDPVIQTFPDYDKKRLSRLCRTYSLEEFNKIDAKALQAKGAGIYFSQNGFSSNRRLKYNLTSINGVHCDVDVCKEGDCLSKLKRAQLKKIKLEEVLSFPLSAHFVIDTKNGLQPIWLVKDFTVNYMAGIQKYLTKLFDGDTAASPGDPTRVLRLPGFLHQKNRNEPYRCELIVSNKNLPRYTVTDFLEIINKDILE